jgi:lipid-A-disaccharide synthase-like uncharacterized protein
MTTAETVWVTVGALGQVCFGLRMLVQWWVSEKKGESVVPVAFWYFSLAGAVMLLAYAVWRMDPIFIAGQLLPLGVYVRNLMLIGRRRKASREDNDRDEPTMAIPMRTADCSCPCTCGARKAA